MKVKAGVMKPPMTPDTIPSGYMIKRDNIQSNTIQHNNTQDKLFFPKKNELPQVGFALCSLDRVLYMYMYIHVLCNACTCT